MKDIKNYSIPFVIERDGRGNERSRDQAKYAPSLHLVVSGLSALPDQHARLFWR